MAMEIVRVIEDCHQSAISAVAYNIMKKEVYTAACDEKSFKCWDIRTGELLRVHQGHHGAVTCLVFCTTVKLLISGSVDATIILWSDRGKVMQSVKVGKTIHCLAWNNKLCLLALGCHSLVRVFKISNSDVLALTRQWWRQTDDSAAAPGKGGGDGGQEAALTFESEACLLKEQLAPLQGPTQGHTDIVHAIAISDSGKIYTAGFDRCLCQYDIERPHDSFWKVEGAHNAAIHSMSLDTENNWVLTGGHDGCFKVWSMEGRVLDDFPDVGDKPVYVNYVPLTHNYWVTARFDRLQSIDPRAPANISEFICDASSLYDHCVRIMLTPASSDLVIAATESRSLLVWRYMQSGSYRAFCGSEGWLEDLVVAKVNIPLLSNIDEKQAANLLQDESLLHRLRMQKAEEEDQPPIDNIFTAGSDGVILRWALDQEQNCDVFKIEEEIRMSNSNLLALLYCAELNCLICGGEDCVIRMFFLDRRTPMHGDDPLPTFLKGHTDRITGLSVLKLEVLASISHDRTLCFWDLHTMKLIGQVENAHDSPMQCMEYVRDRDELATCGMETIAKVRWSCHKESWVTAADDDTIRMWSPMGEPVHCFNYSGGSVQRLFVDEFNQLLVAAMQDKGVRVYALGDPTPKAKYEGHSEVVRAIGILPDRGLYATAGWDKTLRLWWATSGVPLEVLARQRRAENQLPRGDEDCGFVSAYEKAHPLEVPQALKQSNEAMIRALLMRLQSTEATPEGTSRSGKAPRGRRKGKKGGGRKLEADSKEELSALGQKLAQLEQELLAEIMTGGGSGVTPASGGWSAS